MTSVITAASGDPFTYFCALKYTASRARAFWKREREVSAKKATGKRKMDRSILERKEKEARVIILPWTSAAPWARLGRFLRTRWRTSSTTSRRFSSTRRSSQRWTFDLLSVVLNEDFLMVCLFIRFSEEANPSQKYARRVVVVVVLRSNVYYEGLTKSEQLDGAVASGS